LNLLYDLQAQPAIAAISTAIRTVVRQKRKVTKI